MSKAKKTMPHTARKKITANKGITKRTTLKKSDKDSIVKKSPKSGMKRSTKKSSPASKASAKKFPAGATEALRDEVLKILDDRQGEEIVAIDLTGKSSMADYLIVASGRSARQIAAMAHYLREAFIKRGIKHIRVEGLPEGNWALVDGGDVVVHLFRPEVRSYYDLESLWDKKTGKTRQAE